MSTSNSARSISSPQEFPSSNGTNGSDAYESSDSPVPQPSCCSKPGPRGGHQLVVDASTGTYLLLSSLSLYLSHFLYLFLFKFLFFLLSSSFSLLSLLFPLSLFVSLVTPRSLGLKLWFFISLYPQLGWASYTYSDVT